MQGLRSTIIKSWQEAMDMAERVEGHRRPQNIIGIFRSSVAAGRAGAGWRAAILLAMTLLATVLLLAVPATAASGGASGNAPLALPTPVKDGALPATPDETAIRDTVSRLSDAEAREMLLEQLDALARQRAATAQPAAGFVRDFRGSLQRIREGLADLVAAVPQVPSMGPMIAGRLTEGRDRGIGTLLLAAVGIFAAALAGEQLFRRLFTAFRPAPAAARTALSFIDRLCILALRLIADLLSIAVFAVIAIAIFFILYTGHEPVRAAFAGLLWAIILPRTAAAVARFAVAPRRPELRLARLGDSAARAIFRSSVIVVGAIGAAVLLIDVLVATGVSEELKRLYGMAVSFVILSLIIVWIWWWRRPISRSILEGDETISPGGQPSRVRQLVAANWHVFATCFIAGIWMMSIVQRLLTNDPQTAPILISLCILLAFPVADAALRATVAAMLRSPQEVSAPGSAGALPLTGSGMMPSSRSRMQYRAVLVRNLRLILVVIAIIVLARVWDVDMQSMAASSVGETVAEALLEITIILVLASAAWGIVKIAIANAAPERGQAEAEGEIGGKGRSRSETLLPLIGNFILVAIVVITILAVLSALGVAIGPLIAGAGVIGIAIGFGAQTLVRDVLSGIFFLIDDAFRTGEYIDTGGVRGTVEHISIRSLRLRHHRGPLHTIPFGEIQHLTNFSRDWAIEKLELRVPYDTDLEKVRKIIKSVGQDLMDHPEHGPNFLQPLKSQGVNRMDDSAFIVRVKFMAKPGEQFVLRREVFRRIQQAFSDNGIHFAPRRVIVETAADAAGAAAALAAEEAAPVPGPGCNAIR